MKHAPLGRVYMKKTLDGDEIGGHAPIGGGEVRHLRYTRNGTVHILATVHRVLRVYVRDGVSAHTWGGRKVWHRVGKNQP
jgi:hypothetical protein